MDPILATLPHVTADGGRLCISEFAGLAWQPNPKPFDYGESYFQDYVGKKGTPIAANLCRVRAATVYGILGEQTRQDRPVLIDLGIGSGEFLEWMTGRREHNRIDTYGYDINPVAEAWLRERDQWRDPYEGDLIGPGTILTLWDTLEHIPEPARLFERMLPGSHLACSLPVFPDTREQTIVGSKHYKPDEHLIYVTRGGFILWMERHGFTFLRYHTGETQAGRESIGTFVFQRK